MECGTLAVHLARIYPEMPRCLLCVFIFFFFNNDIISTSKDYFTIFQVEIQTEGNIWANGRQSGTLHKPIFLTQQTSSSTQPLGGQSCLLVCFTHKLYPRAISCTYIRETPLKQPLPSPSLRPSADSSLMPADPCQLAVPPCCWAESSPWVMLLLPFHFLLLPPRESVSSTCCILF